MKYDFVIRLYLTPFSFLVSFVYFINLFSWIKMGIMVILVLFTGIFIISHSVPENINIAYLKCSNYYEMKYNAIKNKPCWLVDRGKLEAYLVSKHENNYSHPSLKK